MDSMSDIVDNLLELSRWQSDRLLLSASPVDIAEVINEVVQSSFRKAAGHRIATDIAPGLPAVRADQTRVERILDNLIDNAMKYSPPMAAT